MDYPRRLRQGSDHMLTARDQKCRCRPFVNPINGLHVPVYYENVIMYANQLWQKGGGGGGNNHLAYDEWLEHSHGSIGKLFVLDYIQRAMRYHL